MTTSRRIVQCFRAPVGGLFRHVCDLVTVLSEMGHEVGLVCDSRLSGGAAASWLARLEDICALGLVRVPMSRQIGWRDIGAYQAVRNFVRDSRADIVHGHGAKGGAYARLAARSLVRHGHDVAAFYTPHGGSLHYAPDSLLGALYLSLERRLAPHTAGLIFTSAYSRRMYQEKIGPYPCEAWVVPNGLWPMEFEDVVLDADAADFLFVGELRSLKGVGVLLSALGALRRDHAFSAIIIGSGPDERAFKRLAKQLGLTDNIAFHGPMPARAAFPRGRCLVVPSHAESFPYVALEAAAAQRPVIMTDAGGIPEMVSGTDISLVPPGDADALKARLAAFLDAPQTFVKEAQQFRSIVAERYTVSAMARAIAEHYEECLRASAATLARPQTARSADAASSS